MRSAAIQVDFIPEFVFQKVKFDASKASATAQFDRVGTYASVLFGAVN
jgi:hypothetical protein